MCAEHLGMCVTEPETVSLHENTQKEARGQKHTSQHAQVMMSSLSETKKTTIKQTDAVQGLSAEHGFRIQVQVARCRPRFDSHSKQLLANQLYNIANKAKINRVIETTEF